MARPFQAIPARPVGGLGDADTRTGQDFGGRAFIDEKVRGAERAAISSTGDLLTQLESVDFLRRHRHLSVAETQLSLSISLRTLLS